MTDKEIADAIRQKAKEMNDLSKIAQDAGLTVDLAIHSEWTMEHADPRPILRTDVRRPL